VETGRTRRKTTRRPADLQSISRPPSQLGSNSEVLLHSGSISSQANLIICSVVPYRAGACTRSPIGVLAGVKLLVKDVGVGDRSDKLHQKMATEPSLQLGEVRRTAGSSCQGPGGPIWHQTTPVLLSWGWLGQDECQESGPGQELTDPEQLRHWGPEQELTQWRHSLLSSATRSSLITILLLQPVFFLRSASRPGPS